MFRVCRLSLTGEYLVYFLPTVPKFLGIPPVFLGHLFVCESLFKSPTYGRRFGLVFLLRYLNYLKYLASPLCVGENYHNILLVLRCKNGLLEKLYTNSPASEIQKTSIFIFLKYAQYVCKLALEVENVLKIWNSAVV